MKLIGWLKEQVERAEKSYQSRPQYERELMDKDAEEFLARRLSNNVRQ